MEPSPRAEPGSPGGPDARAPSRVCKTRLGEENRRRGHAERERARSAHARSRGSDTFRIEAKDGMRGMKCMRSRETARHL